MPCTAFFPLPAAVVPLAHGHLLHCAKTGASRDRKMQLPAATAHMKPGEHRGTAAALQERGGRALQPRGRLSRSLPCPSPHIPEGKVLLREKCFISEDPLNLRPRLLTVGHHKQMFPFNSRGCKDNQNVPKALAAPWHWRAGEALKHLKIPLVSPTAKEGAPWAGFQQSTSVTMVNLPTSTPVLMICSSHSSRACLLNPIQNTSAVMSSSRNSAIQTLPETQQIQ